MFVEYIKLLGSGIQPEFSFDYILPMALILMSVVAIVFIGYKLKEELGAIIAILICGIFFLYMNDLLRIVDAYTLSSPSKQTVPKSAPYSDFSSRAPKKAKMKEVEKSKLNSTHDSALSGKYSVYIHYSREENKKQVEEFAIFLKNQGFKVEGMERINYKNRDVRYFHGEDKSGAILLKKKLTQFVKLYTNFKNTNIKIFNLGPKYPNAKKGTLELWLAL